MDELADMHNQQADQMTFMQVNAAAPVEQQDTPPAGAGVAMAASFMDESYSPPPTKPRYTEQQLGMMPDWIETSKRMYRVMEGYEFIGSDKQAAAYGMDLMAEFNWNVTGPAGFPGEAGISSPGLIGQVWNVLNSGGYTDLDGNLVTKENNANDFLFMLDTYADTKTEGATIKRSFRALFGAPETYGSIGGGIAAPFIKAAAMKSSSMTARQMLMGVAKAAGFTTEIAKRAPGKSGAVAGAAYADIYEGANMILETAAGMPPSLGEAVTRTVTSSLAGAGFGGVAGKVLGGAVEGAGPNTPPIRQEPDLGLPDDIQPRYFEPGKFEPPTAENPVSVVLPTETEPGIIAFHGSGADFDKFKLEFIGTGEGAQAYGYGLYFTDSEDIAKFYRDAVGGKNINRMKKFDDIGQALKGKMTLTTDIIDNIIDKKIKVSSLPKEAQSSVKEILKRKEPPTTKRIYKVAITPKPEEMLDYQTTFADQPESVKAAVKNLGYDPDKTFEAVENGNRRVSVMSIDALGREERADFIDGVAGATAQQQADKYISDQKTKMLKMPMPLVLDQLKTIIAQNEGFPGFKKSDAEKILSERLLAEGVPGIKYRAAGSRAANIDAADAEMNYVIFDENAIKILEKYGIVGPVAITAVAAGQGADSDEGEVM